MVALASTPTSTPTPPLAASTTRRAEWAWSGAALAVLAVGLVIRLLVGGGRVGDVSAIVMTALLSVAAWLAARLVVGPRAALIALTVLLVLLELAALPARNVAEYDDLEAFYRTDQVLSAQLAVPASGQNLAITLLAQPVFDGTQPQFGLAGEVNGSSVAWSCAFQRGIQRLALPVPANVNIGTGTADVRLHLTGSPDHTSQYLVAYASSKLGGFVIGLEPMGSLDARATRCAPA